jgi:abortive infection bacteriophage resistance protein
MSRAPRHGAFPTIHDEFVAQVRECVARSSELFVSHFRSKYASEADLPFWMAAEVMTFGMVLTCFKHLQPRMRKEIARTFVTPAPVLESWLLTINYVRNVCAHHGRLWNRQLSIRPQIPDPKNIPAWHKPGIIPNERSFAVLTLLRHLLQHVAPQSAWERRLGSLLKEYPDVPLAEMGFPVEWRKCPIWADLAEDWAQTGDAQTQTGDG